MKKMRIALASMLVAAGITATAGAANFTNCADRLKDVGLFQGTNQGYQLDKAPTRAEASAMLVRLLGKEAEAEKLTYTAPFTGSDAGALARVLLKRPNRANKFRSRHLAGWNRRRQG